MTVFIKKTAVLALVALYLCALPSRALSSENAGAERAGGAAQEKTAALPDLIDRALAENPRIKAAGKKWGAATEARPISSSLEDPMISYTQPIEKIETRLGPQERMYGVSQRFPFPGRLGVQGRIAEKDAEIAKTEYELTVRAVVTEVKKNFYELSYLDNAIALARENKAVLEYFTGVSRANYGLSVSGLDELVRAQRLSAGASSELIMLGDMREGVVARLNALLNRAPGETLGRAEEPALKSFDRDVEELYGLALANQERVRLAGLRLEKSELQTELSRYSYLPNFTIGFAYSEIGESPMPLDDSGQDAMSATIGISVPLWFGKNRAVRRSSELSREGTLMEKQAVSNEVLTEVRTAYYNMTRAGKLARLYGETLVPEARQSVDFAEARYKSGEERLGGLLETQSMWINFRLVYHRALADYFKGIAELERLTAEDLP